MYKATESKTNLQQHKRIMLPNSNTNLFFSHHARLGLEQPSTSSSTTCKRAERKTAAARPGLEWTGVTVLREHPTTPHVKCMYCGDCECAIATRATPIVSEAKSCQELSVMCVPLPVLMKPAHTQLHTTHDST